MSELIFIDDLEVWITRKKVKNLNLRVKPPNGRIDVSLPLHFPLDQAKRFIAQKRPWILRQQERIKHSPQSTADSPTPAELKEWKALVQACVPVLIDQWEPIIGVKAGKLAYRNMTSRWGSCQPATGRICINTRLALYPPQCLEYVVVHELCHLRERSHGPAFYALMDLYLPDWRERRALLR